MIVQMPTEFVAPKPGETWIGYFGDRPAKAFRRMISPLTSYPGTVFNVAPEGVAEPELVWVSDFVVASNGWHKA